MASEKGGPWKPAAPEPPDWSAATAYLADRDPVLGPWIRKLGPCSLGPRPNSFGTLAGAIVAQQISAAAARSIYERLVGLTGDPPEAERLLRRRDKTLRGIGLSRQKITYLRDLASRIGSGELDLEALPSLSDEEVIARLTAVRGIGEWTAHMHLIFTLNRPDVFAPGDAAVLAAMRDLYGIAEDVRPAEYAAAAERWRPFRSVGVWYMYEYIHDLRRGTLKK